MTRAIPRTPRDGGWALRVALIVSVLVHLAIYVAGTLGYQQIARAVDPSATTLSPTVPSQEIVTISNPLVIERRTTRAPSGGAAQTPFARPPQHFDFPSGPFGRTRSTPVRTPAQIAFAQAMLEHARERSAADPNDPATAPEKYQLSMRGKNTKLRRGQGIYFPTRGWRQDGLDCYDASYEFVYPDGTDEKGSVPWPIHFTPGSDPFFSSDPSALSRTPMPGPPPGYVPPGDLGKALRAYFPSLHFEDAAL